VSRYTREADLCFGRMTQETAMERLVPGSAVPRPRGRLRARSLRALGFHRDGVRRRLVCVHEFSGPARMPPTGGRPQSRIHARQILLRAGASVRPLRRSRI